MRKLSPDFADHLAQDSTTLCRVFVLSLADGRRFAFTDHDQPLSFDGLSAKPMNAAQTEARAGMEADSGELKTVFDIDLDADAIQTGVLAEAQLREYRVNWEAPDQFAQIAAGRIGEVTLDGSGFTADWLGLATRLSRSTGRVFARRCDAEFGDARCGLNAADFPDGTVCPRTFSACRTQFSNAVNFRGFPYLIGDDALQAPLDGAGQRDGGSRYEG